MHKKLFLDITFLTKIFYFSNGSVIGAEKLPKSGEFFSAVFSKLVLRGQRDILRWSSLWKSFRFKSKTIVISSKNSLTLCRNFKAGGPNCNLHVQKSIPRKIFFRRYTSKNAVELKNFEFLVKTSFSIVKQVFNTNRWTISGRKRLPRESFQFVFLFPGLEFENLCFGAKSRQIVKGRPN